MKSTRAPNTLSLRLFVKYAKLLFIPILLLSVSSHEAKKISQDDANLGFKDFSQGYPKMTIPGFMNMCHRDQFNEALIFLPTLYSDLEEPIIEWCALKACFIKQTTFLEALYRLGMNFNKLLGQLGLLIVDSARVPKDKTDNIIEAMDFILSLGVNPNIKIPLPGGEVTLLGAALINDMDLLVKILFKYNVDMYQKIALNEHSYPMDVVINKMTSLSMISYFLKSGYDFDRPLQDGDSLVRVIMKLYFYQESIGKKDNILIDLKKLAHTEKLLVNVESLIERESVNFKIKKRVFDVLFTLSAQRVWIASAFILFLLNMRAFWRLTEQDSPALRRFMQQRRVSNVPINVMPAAQALKLTKTTKRINKSNESIKASDIFPRREPMAIEPVKKDLVEESKLVTKFKDSIELQIEAARKLCESLLNTDVVKSEGREKQFNLLSSYKKECKTQDGEVAGLSEKLTQCNDIGTLEVIHAELKVLEQKTKSLNMRLEEEKNIIERSKQTLLKHKEKQKLIERSVVVEDEKQTKPVRSIASVSLSVKVLPPAGQRVFDFPPVQSAPAEAKHPVSSHRKNCLNAAFSYLININLILSLGERDIEASVKRYALIYNIFRCFHTLKSYKNNGGDISLAFDETIIMLRHMLIHGGADIVSDKKLILTAQQLSELMPQRFLEIRKPHLLKSALSEQQRKELISAFNMADETYQSGEFPLLIEQTPLFIQLSAFHQSLTSNNKNVTDLTGQVINDYMPLMQHLVRYINPQNHSISLFKKTMNHDAFINKYLFELQALQMIVTICGEFSPHFADVQNHQLKTFMQYARGVRNATAHKISDADLGWEFCVRLQEALDAFTSKDNLRFAASFSPLPQG